MVTEYIAGWGWQRVAVRDGKDKFGPKLAFDAQGRPTFIGSFKSN
ncbi:hypothetical protein ACFYMB_20965 [Micromonospora haikouensis]